MWRIGTGTIAAAAAGFVALGACRASPDTVQAGPPPADTVRSGEMALGISMYPTTIDQLLAVADAGEIMPPKSTWFEPKLRSGLFVHELDQVP